MRDTDYAYAVARIRANETKLLSGDFIESLVDAPSFEQALSMLRMQGWLEDPAITDISAMLSKQSETLWTLLKESVPDQDELGVLCAQNDFHNVKAALKCMLTNADPTPYYVQPTSLDLAELTKRIGAHDFSALPPMIGACAKKAYEAACQTESGQSADILVDEAALSYLMARAKATDCALLREMLEFICDSVNMKVAFRCARTNKDLSFAESAIGPCALLDRQSLCEAAVQGEEKLLRFLLLSPYSDGAEKLKQSTTAFEKWCDDTLTEKAKRAKYIFFGFEPIAAYYFAKTAELKCVRIVLSAKQSGVPREVIRERVRALYV